MASTLETLARKRPGTHEVRPRSAAYEVVGPVAGQISFGVALPRAPQAPSARERAGAPAPNARNAVPWTSSKTEPLIATAAVSVTGRACTTAVAQTVTAPATPTAETRTTAAPTSPVTAVGLAAEAPAETATPMATAASLGRVPRVAASATAPSSVAAKAGPTPRRTATVRRSDAAVSGPLARLGPRGTPPHDPPKAPVIGAEAVPTPRTPSILPTPRPSSLDHQVAAGPPRPTNYGIFITLIAAGGLGGP